MPAQLGLFPSLFILKHFGKVDGKVLLLILLLPGAALLIWSAFKNPSSLLQL